MLKNLEPKTYGSAAERAACVLIHYFRMAIGEDAFRRNEGDLETEITDIVKNTVNAAVDETCKQISRDQLSQLQEHVGLARTKLDMFAQSGHLNGKTQDLYLAVAHLTNAMNRIVERLG